LRPSLWIAFDDEGAGRCVELVRMRREYAGVVFTKRERQSVEKVIRAVPDVFVGARAQVRLKLLRELLTHRAVDAIRADEQIEIVSQRFDVVDFTSEVNADAKRFASPLQNFQESNPGNA